MLRPAFGCPGVQRLFPIFSHRDNRPLRETRYLSDVSRERFEGTGMAWRQAWPARPLLDGRPERPWRQGPLQEWDVARLTPPIHGHINMRGRYSFAVPEEVARRALRPLRDPDDDP